jgi:DNA-directed RNA polymerase specialized sigma subunit
MKNQRRTEGLTQLIERAKTGNPKDLEELYQRFRPIIMKMARRMSIEYREDARHELITELFEAVQRFEPNTDWGRKELHRHFEKRKKP